MKKLVNGQYIELTPEEIAAMQKEQAKAEAYERKRPLTESEVSRMLITEQINTLAVDDQTALRMMDFYPTFAELCAKAYKAEKAGYKFTHGGKLWKTVQPGYTFAAHYAPGTGMESLYERIDETHDGSEYDPIPYDGNMALESSKYYTQDGVTYLCTRDSGNAVYHPLAELVGVYVELA